MRSWGRAGGAATTVPLSVPRPGQPADSASLPVSAPPTPARRALKLHWPGETGPPCAQRPHGPAPFGPHIPHRKHVGSRSPPTPGAGLPGRAASTSGRTCGRRRRQLGPAATCDPCGSPHSQLATLWALRCAGLTGLVRSLRPAPVYSPLTKHGEAVRGCRLRSTGTAGPCRAPRKHGLV